MVLGCDELVCPGAAIATRFVSDTELLVEQLRSTAGTDSILTTCGGCTGRRSGPRR